MAKAEEDADEAETEAVPQVNLAEREPLSLLAEGVYSTTYALLPP